MLNLVLLISGILHFISCPASAGTIRVFHESFDTSSLSNADLFDSRYGDVDIRDGLLRLYYSSSQYGGLASGIECRLPQMPEEVSEREIELRMTGGGSDLSNSVFVCYAVGPGDGLCLPPLPGRFLPNTRTGYILRFIHHGDGTNELKIYRNDGGWVKELKSEGLPANPTTSLTRLVIRHRREGMHEMRAEFAGRRKEHRTSFRDASYAPGNARREMNLIAKGHAGVTAKQHIHLDAISVHDRTGGTPRAAASLQSKSPGSRPRDLDMAKELARAKMFAAQNNDRKAWKICQTILSYDSRSAEAFELCGQIESRASNDSSAAFFYQRALELRTARSGPEHPSLAEDLFALARIYARKDPADAERLYIRTLVLLEKYVGPETIALVEPLRGLAHLYVTVDSGEAARLFERVVSIQERHQGAGHPDQAADWNDLAVLYAGMSRYEEASAAHLRALDIREKHLGPAHPEVEATLRRLAELYETQHKSGELQALYERSLPIREKMLGQDHPDVGILLSNLALVYQSQFRDKEAEALMIRSTAILERSLGPNHIKVAYGLNNLAKLYYERQMYDKAAPLFRRAAGIMKQALGPTHEQVGLALNNLAAVYDALRQYPLAEEAYREALVILEREYGPDHQFVANGLANFAMHYKIRGRPADAEPMYSRALSIMESAGDHGPYMATVLEHLSDVCRQLNRPAEAEGYAAQAQKIRQERR